MALVGTGAAAAALAGIVLLNTAGSGEGGPASTYPSTVALSTAPSAATLPEGARDVETSLVWLTVTTAHGVTRGCGVAVASGGLVATSAAAVDGATSVMVTGTSGPGVRARVVAVDRGVGVALLRVGRNLPVPRFEDDNSVAVGRPAMVMSAAAGRTGTPAVTWAPATIASVGTAVGTPTAGAMAEIGVAVTDRAAVPGSVLVQDGRGVIGILGSGGAATATSSTGTAVWRFVPAPLLLGITGELERWGHVRHGWLNVTADDAAPPAGQTGTVGARVVKVTRGGVAQWSLRPGDVIVAIGGSPVRSMAELRARLYVLRAGQPVSIAVRRGGAAVTTEIALGSSP
jgi:S1-C subfamily serine protease